MKLILFLSLFVAVSAVHANEPMQPFGGILWTDDFIEVAKKINDLGPETLLVKISESSSPIKGSINKETLEKKLGEIYEERYPKDFDPKWESRTSLQRVKYKDGEGRERIYLQRGYRIFASPVVIAGVPFELEAVFVPSPGLAVVSWDSVLIEPKIGYTFPLVLSEIILSSTSHSLADKYEEINDILKKKYSKYDDTEYPRLYWLKRKNGGDVFDGYGNSITLHGSRKSYSIKYKGVTYSNELREKYRKHLANLESNKIKGKKDMGSGL